MSYIDHAMTEFRAAGWTDENGKFKDEMQEDICNHVLKLLELFADEGHSGYSADYAMNLFTRLAKFEPIAPLTGEDWEWDDISHLSGRTHYQNKRMSSVFKDDTGVWQIDGRVFWEWYKNDAGEVIRTYYTSKNSSTPVIFPYNPPDKPEYVFVPTEEYPEENYNGK